MIFPKSKAILAACRGKRGKRQQSGAGVVYWDFRKKVRHPPLPSRLSPRQWQTLEKLYMRYADRDPNAVYPLIGPQRPILVLPHEDFEDKNTVNDLKSIAAIMGTVRTEEYLIVINELQL
jgi:hypothetical protein